MSFAVIAATSIHAGLKTHDGGAGVFVSSQWRVASLSLERMGIRSVDGRVPTSCQNWCFYERRSV